MHLAAAGWRLASFAIQWPHRLRAAEGDLRGEVLPSAAAHGVTAGCVAHSAGMIIAKPGVVGLAMVRIMTI